MSRKKTISLIAILVLLVSISILVYFQKSKKANNPASAGIDLKGKAPASVDKSKSEDKNNDSDNKTKTGVKPSESQPTLINIEVPSSQKWGNTPGNIRNFGNLAFQDGYLYFYVPGLMQNNFLQPSIYIHRTKEDGITALTKLKLTTEPVFLNVVGEWIYFCSGDNGELCRIKVNGTELEIIDSKPTINLIVYDNALYYIQWGKLYKSSISNLTEKKLIAENVYYFVLSDDGNTIFYCTLSRGFDGDISNLYYNKIYSVDTNGENLRLIYNSGREMNIEEMMIYKYYIYFKPLEFDVTQMTIKTDFYIGRIDYTSSNPVEEKYITFSSPNIVSSHDIKMNLYDNYLYYTNIDYDSFKTTIYRQNLDDGSIESLAVDNLAFINSGLYCFGHKVYFIGEKSYDRMNSFSQSLYCLDFQNKSILRNDGPSFD